MCIGLGPGSLVGNRAKIKYPLGSLRSPIFLALFPPKELGPGVSPRACQKRVFLSTSEIRKFILKMAQEFVVYESTRPPLLDDAIWYYAKHNGMAVTSSFRVSCLLTHAAFQLATRIFEFFVFKISWEACPWTPLYCMFARISNTLTRFQRESI